MESNDVLIYDELNGMLCYRCMTYVKAG